MAWITKGNESEESKPAARHSPFFEAGSLSSTMPHMWELAAIHGNAVSPYNLLDQ